VDAVLRLTGSHQAPVESADYVFCDASSLTDALTRVKDGTLEYPDQSATVICDVQDIHEPSAEFIELSGPGINQSIRVHVHGFESAALSAFAQRNALPPTGVDVVFVSQAGHVTCLSRYTKLRLED
jgi:alpha-D-ribose 1-methylphosphonate 5-triphosphate synthase subunit PhnH